MAEFLRFLRSAQQARLTARALPEEAELHKGRCRYWLAMARKAQPPPLP